MRGLPGSDEALWESSVAGNGEAFGVLFDRHRDRVFRHALHLVERRVDAEDVTAVAFLELWRRRRDVRLVHGSVLPWLQVTTTNTALNVRRGLRRHRAFLARLPGGETAPDPAILTEEGPLGVSPGLRGALGALPEVDRQLFALVVLADYPLADASQLLELSAAAGKARLHRTRTRLRAALGERTPVGPSVSQGGQQR